MDQAVKARKTRQIKIGGTKVGGDAPVVVQSMCATRTIDVDETVAQAHQLANAGAGIVRIAIDSEKEIPAVKEIREQTKGVVLSVDLQENYKIADRVAPYVDKIRYNPGHLHHIEKSKTIEQKVKWLVEVARDNDVAIRIGGAGVPRQVSGRSAGGDRRVGRVPLRSDGRARLHALRRVAEGLRSGQGDGRESAVLEAPARRADSSRRHGSGAATGWNHQDANRVREAARAEYRR